MREGVCKRKTASLHVIRHSRTPSGDGETRLREREHFLFACARALPPPPPSHTRKRPAARYMPTFKSGDDSPPSSSVPWGMPAPAEGGSPVLGAPAVALTTSVSAEKGAPMEPSKQDRFAGAGASTLELAPLEPLSMIFHNLRYSVSNRKGALAILKSVSGHALHSRLTALLGPSGAGKVRQFWGEGREERGRGGGGGGRGSFLSRPARGPCRGGRGLHGPGVPPALRTGSGRWHGKGTKKKKHRARAAVARRRVFFFFGRVRSPPPPHGGQGPVPPPLCHRSACASPGLGLAGRGGAGGGRGGGALGAPKSLPPGAAA